MKVAIIGSVDLASGGAGANYLRELLSGVDNLLLVPPWMEDTADVRVVVPNSIKAIERALSSIESRPMPTVTVVWDELEFLLSGRRGRSARREKEAALIAYKRVLEKTDFCIGMTEKMCANLREYGLKAPALVGPYSASREIWEIGDINLDPRTSRERRGLVLPGSGYAWREINEFAAALRSTNESLTVIGGLSKASKCRAILVERPLAEAELAYRIGGFAAGYVPYWRRGFKSGYVASAHPSKMSVCIASGTPIIYHGPQSGSPMQYLKGTSLGIGITKATGSVVSNFLVHAATDRYMAEFVDARERARHGPIGPGALGRVFDSAASFALSEWC